jgi:Arc/MetJ family transcription regulator
MNIPDELIKKAAKMAGVRTKTELVKIALEEFIKRRRIEKLINQSGNLEFISDDELEHQRHKR